ncbi:MAG TPA: ABC transporter ATP-binding protein [Candidatus Korarchaeota archaeon]|nr:ABC transporter ATP-binding protein [Candidatus Korarchaeota archaeon]
MLSVENLEAGYGDVQVLWGVSLRVEKGEIVALLGSNGAGKTTTLKTISGLLKPKSGKIAFDGVEITGKPPHEVVRLGISLVPEGRRLFPKMTVYENLRMGAYLVSGDVSDRLETVYSLFPILKERRNQLAGTLSGGEQQMLAIARGLMSSPRLLMLDEPSLGLAPKIVQEVLRAVNQIRDEGVTVLLVEQNVQQALSIADRGYVIETGRIVLEGTGRELLENEHVKTAYLGL